MHGKTLQLVFDPAVAFEEELDATVVYCADAGLGEAPLGILTRREFYGESYDSTGKEVCLWWLRLLSWKDPSGVCLHDLFAWGGKSALWYTDIPSLHPDKRPLSTGDGGDSGFEDVSPRRGLASSHLGERSRPCEGLGRQRCRMPDNSCLPSRQTRAAPIRATRRSDEGFLALVRGKPVSATPLLEKPPAEAE